MLYLDFAFGHCVTGLDENVLLWVETVVKVGGPLVAVGGCWAITLHCRLYTVRR